MPVENYKDNWSPIYAMKRDRKHGQWEALRIPYFDNQLAPALRKQMSDHVRQCPVCQAELRRLFIMRRLLRQNELPAPLANGEAVFWQRLAPRLQHRSRRQRMPRLAQLPSLLYVTVVLLAHLIFFGWVGWALNQWLNIIPLQVQIPEVWQSWLYAFLAGPFSLLFTFFADIAPDWVRTFTFMIGPTLLFLFALAGITWLYLAWSSNQETENGEYFTHGTT